MEAFVKEEKKLVYWVEEEGSEVSEGSSEILRVYEKACELRRILTALLRDRAEGPHAAASERERKCEIC